MDRGNGQRRPLERAPAPRRPPPRPGHRPRTRRRLGHRRRRVNRLDRVGQDRLEPRCPANATTAIHGGITMPDTTPGSPQDPAATDTASLPGLLSDYGALWDITRAPRGYTARRRPRPAPPTVLPPATIPALREFLEHGYDTAALAALTRDFTGWQIEHVDPGSTWAAISRDHHPAQMITASDLDGLRASLARGQHDTPGHP